MEVAAKTEVKRSKTMKYVSCLIRFLKKYLRYDVCLIRMNCLLLVFKLTLPADFLPGGGGRDLPGLPGAMLVVKLCV